jgi:hypothetical protein
MSKRDSMQSKKQQCCAFLSKSVWPTDILSTRCLFDAIVTHPYFVNQSLLIPCVLAKCLSAEWFLTKRHGAKASKEKTICNFFPKKSNFFRMQNFFSQNQFKDVFYIKSLILCKSYFYAPAAFSQVPFASQTFGQHIQYKKRLVDQMMEQGILKGEVSLYC